MATTSLDPDLASPGTRSGKYLTFTLGQEAYGIPVLKVREIIRLVDITAVPQMPSHILGVINLRGKIVPVADLRVKFGMVASKASDTTCIVVVHVKLESGGTTHMGVMVDGVEEVINLSQSDIEETPDFGSSLSSDYLLGMAKVKTKVVSLLDIDKALVSRGAESNLAVSMNEAHSGDAVAPPQGQSGSK